MSRAVNISTSGNYCGRAVNGVSNLSGEDMRQIEAHRAKDRPTPWAHLAARYGVNELDLRNLFHPAANDDQPRPHSLPAAVKVAPAPPTPRNLTHDRETMFRGLWASGQPKSVIAHQMNLSHSQIDRLRVKLKLPIRQDGSKPNEWREAESAYVLRHYVAGGQSAETVAQALPGRSAWAVVGHAHRKGWTRTHHPDVRP